MKKILKLIACLLLACNVSATEFHVSTAGSSNGAGTLSSPWNLQTAIIKTTIVKGGDIIWLHGGTYQVGGKAYIYKPKIKGVAGNNIIIRNYNSEEVIIDGGIYCTAGDGAYITTWGLEVTSSIPGRVAIQEGSWPDTWRLPDANGATTEYCVPGIFLQSPGDKAINCYVHDCIGGGLSIWSPDINGELNGNIVVMNGWVSTDRGHGHGIYAQNAITDPRKLVMDNMLANNADHGAQFYGSDKAPPCNFDVVGNIFINNGDIYTNASAIDKGRNLLVGGGTISYNNTVAFNYAWRSPSSPIADSDADWYMGYDQNTVGLKTSNNLVVGTAQFNIGTDTVMLNNTYILPNIGTFTFGHGMSKNTFPNNSYITSIPTAGLQYFLRKNLYEPAKANLIIYNWSKANSVTVDVSNVYSPGDVIKLRNIQDYKNDIITVTNVNGKIVVSMINHSVLKPIGSPKPATSFPGVGGFRSEKVGTSTNIVVNPSPTNTAPTIASIPDQTINEGASLGPITFAINDKETPVGLTLTASSSNTSVVPNSSLILDGTVTNRTIYVAPFTTQVGTTIITVTVSDGTNTASDGFVLNVLAVLPTNQTMTCSNKVVTIKDTINTKDTIFNTTTVTTSHGRIISTKTSLSTNLATSITIKSDTNIVINPEICQ